MKRNFLSRGIKRKPVLATAVHGFAALLIFAGAFAASRKQAAPPIAQPSRVPQWQIGAGGKMAFDAASVKEDRDGSPLRMNINLGALDSPVDGFLSANVPVSWYIGFAYKLNGGQSLFLTPQLPRWATTKRFAIEARAPQGNPSKDQMRLMMQSLLAERFKLAIHAETRELPAFALVLSKPGQTGAQLKPHAEDPPCADPVPASTGQFPFPCGVPTSKPSAGQWTLGARNLTMAQIADYLGGPGDLTRPVVDKTGLIGKFDFRIQFVREPNGPEPNPQIEQTGPAFVEALREQLGLKLETTTAPIEMLIVDHIEEPTPN